MFVSNFFIVSCGRRFALRSSSFQQSTEQHNSTVLVFVFLSSVVRNYVRTVCAHP